MIDFHKAEAAEHEVELTGQGDGIVQANPTLLRRALSNLVSSALAYA
jgi:signal transduction histidine kinase